MLISFFPYAIENCSFLLSKMCVCRAGQSEEAPREAAPVAAAPQVTVIPGVDSLIGDLLDMDIGPPMTQQYHQSMGPPVGAVPSAGGMDLLGEGLDSLVRYLSVISLCVICHFDLIRIYGTDNSIKMHTTEFWS